MKAVLLHDGNRHSSVPLTHAVHMKETYANIQGWLKKIHYKDHQLKISADLEVVAILTGLKGGYTKFCYFLCEWDSSVRDRHYHVKQ